MAEEVWLLPFAAPREYEPYYGEAEVPVNWLPGLFAPKEVDEEAYGELDRIKKPSAGRNHAGPS